MLPGRLRLPAATTAGLDVHASANERAKTGPADWDVTKGRALESPEEREDTSVAAEKRRMRAAGSSLVQSVCVILAIVGAAFLLISFITRAATRQGKSGLGGGLALITALRYSCGTDSCRDAVDALSSSINSSASPCTNPYEYVCGNWGATDNATGAPVAYKSLLKRGYAQAAQGRLQNISSNPCSLDEDVGKVACVSTSGDLDVARAYAMLVPLAKFISANYQLGIDAGRLDNVSKFSLCVNNVNLLFKTTFQKFMSYLQSEKAVVEARHMWADIQIEASKSPGISSDIQLDNAKLQAAKMKAYGAHDSVATNDTVFLPQYGKDFIANLILYNRQTKADLDFDEHLKVTVEDFDIIPTAFFLPDFYYAGATEPSVNFGTLGTHVAGMLFNQSFPNNISVWHGNTAECVKNYASQLLSLEPVGDDWIDYLRAKWSLEISQKVSSSGHKTVRTTLLLLRFAHSFCGEGRKKIERMKFALLTSKTFSDTFGCPKIPEFSC
ncbi:uncharacterized protein LOC144166817 [Haemaphysalis longicornis]